MGTIRETAGYLQIYNIEAAPKDQVNVVHLNGWVFAPYLQLVQQYHTTLVEHPNPPASNLTDIRQASARLDL